MSEYRRLVSYLYAYDAGVKTINVGFAKAELRNGRLKLIVDVKNVMFGQNKADINFFYRKNSEDAIKKEYNKIRIGELNLNNGQGQMQTRIDESEFTSHGIIFENIAGILITENDNIDYAIISSWGEENISPYELVKKTDVYKENSNLIDTLKLKNNQETKLNTDSIRYANNSNCNMEVVDEKDIDKLESDKETINNESIYEAAVIKENNLFSDSAVYELKKIIPEELMEIVLGEMSQMEAMSLQQDMETDMEDTDRNSDIDDTNYNNKISRTDRNRIDNNNLNSARTGDISIVNKIDHIINNSFLMHGYYNYDHIIVGKKYDNDKDKELILIGVPGIFHEKEQFMASMFGFPQFQKTDNDSAKEEYNGYWYTYLEI